MSMALRSLVFSSDRGTAHLLAEALNGLGMEVEHCPEIFGAVERLTLQSFDVLVVDWEDEPEASFLLRAAREMKSNQPPFPVAVVEAQSCVEEARRAGANQVVTKSQARQGLFQFQDRAGSQEVAVFNDVEIATTSTESDLARSEWFAPGTVSPNDSRAENISLSFAGYASRPGKRWPSSHRRAGNSSAKDAHVYKRASTFLLLVVAIFLSVSRLGPVLRPELPSFPVGATLATLRVQLSERLAHFRAPSAGQDLAQASIPEQIFVEPSRLHKRSIPLKISHAPAISELNASAADLLATAAPDVQTLARPAAGIRTDTSEPIPESLKHPPEPLTVRTVVANLAPPLLGALEPVLIPEEVSRKMLLQKVQPSYPEQALYAGLQGPVVLQAWIGRDGRIRDLKLVRGYLVLGRAAFNAVKQWRYQPYYRNGQAMETQTYITVNFTPTTQAERTQ